LARCLIIGCGCRGRALARELVARGHAVRGTSRDERARPVLAAAGVEPFIGDPDRIATLTPALEHVSVACVLLGSATGSEASIEALHGTRLEMLLLRMIDTTVRGIVYEAAGTVDASLLAGGTKRVRAACEDSLIPYAVLDADPLDVDGWIGAAVGAVETVLGA
jgi:uncharacterized protein YbjT (DUF2867 family)